MSNPATLRRREEMSESYRFCEKHKMFHTEDECWRCMMESKDDTIASLTEEMDRLREDYERVCKTVADMHAAAMGEITGPKRGVVEDIYDLKAERDSLKAEYEELFKGYKEKDRLFCDATLECDRLKEELDAMRKPVE